MSTPRKHGIPPAALDMPATAVDGKKVSGAQFEDFRKGWAVSLLASPGTLAHWYERGALDAVRALCSRHSDVLWLYGPGNYGRCQNCIKVMKRRIERGPPL